MAIKDRDEARPVRAAIYWQYLAVPVALGILFGWMGTGWSATWPKHVSVALWIMLNLLGWLGADLGTRAVAPLLRPRGTPLAVTLAVGVILSGFVVVPLSHVIGEFFTLLGYPAPGMARLRHYGPNNVLDSTLAPLCLWVGMNLMFHAFGFARFGYPGRGSAAVAVPDPAQEPAASPRIVARVRPHLRGRLLALQADAHYVRVHTDRGTDLVLYRFGDAVAEMDAGAGAQVHRSWWVARDAVTGTDPERPELVLANGLRVPVSRSYQREARQAGLLAAAPIALAS